MMGSGSPNAEDIEKAEAALAEALRLKRWRARTVIHDLALEFRAAKNRHFDPGETVLHIKARDHGAPLRMLCGQSFIDALLSRAPEPVAFDALSPEDVGLLLEHVMTPTLEAFEKAFGAAIEIESVERFGGSRPLGDMWLDAEAQGKVFRFNIATQSPNTARALAAYVQLLEQSGPGAAAGLSVAIGPVHLSKADIEALTTGDEMMLEGATLEKLMGAVVLDDDMIWPIALIDGGIVVEGALQEIDANLANASPDKRLPILFLVGVTGEASAMKRGDRIPLQRVEEKRMVLRVGSHVLGRAGLVNLPEGLAIRFFGKEGT